MRGRQMFEVVRPGLSALATVLGILPMRGRCALLRSVRGWRGMLGVGIRYSLLASIGSARRSNVSIREQVYLLNVEGLRLGQNVSIHPMCYIDSFGGVEIGDDVSIAHGVTIMSTNHQFDRLDVPINDQGVESRRVEIGDDCWLGAKAVVLAGVKIGRGAVVAAGAVVTKNVPDSAVVAGAPARVLRYRGARDA